jgi:hypothetical protein
MNSFVPEVIGVSTNARIALIGNAARLPAFVLLLMTGTAISASTLYAHLNFLVYIIDYLLLHEL